MSSYMGWQRRSSSLRAGGRPSTQDNGKQQGNHQCRSQERNSRIPVRSSSQPGGPFPDMPVFSRSKSNLASQMQIASTPRGNVPPNFTPLSSLSVTPLFSVSSQKKSQVPHKDQRNLADKEFQREASNMVLGYFQANYPTVLKNSGIRPMEIKMFIDMVNHLFERLGVYHKDALVQFTRSNYEKELPIWMKHLEYPGSITKGWLQTVNVPQYWPQVLGLLSWLVALLHGSDAFDAEKQLFEGTEDDPKQATAVQYFMCCFQAHNQRANGDVDSFSDICRQQLRLEEEAMGITEEEIEKLEAENRLLLAQVNDPQWLVEKDALDELEQRLTVAESQSAKATDEIDRKREAIEGIINEAGKKERNIVILRTEAEKCRNEVQALKGKIDKQAMSIGEFSELKKKCEYALKEIDYMEKESEDIEKMAARYEHEIATKRDKMLQNSHAFNRNVIQLEQQVPNLTRLRARVDPESSTVVEDLEKQVDALKELKSRLVVDCQELETRRREKTQTLERLKAQLQEAIEAEQKIRDATDKTKAEIDAIQESKIEEEKSLKGAVNDLERKTSSFQQKEKERENLDADVQALRNRVQLLDKALTATDAKIEEKWKEAAEKMQFFKDEIDVLQGELACQDELLQKRVMDLIKKYKP